MHTTSCVCKKAKKDIMLKTITMKYFPFLGKYKRYMVGLCDSIVPKSTYSQHQEDLLFVDLLFFNDLKLDEYSYIDIGANHPSSISNTYLLYRKGMYGLAIEPNRELVKLFNRFRPKDIVLNVGCSNQPSLSKFIISRAPVFSSFEHSLRHREIYDSYFVPIMRLDDIVGGLPLEKIFLLSIDVEGLNVEVLEGAINTAKKSLVVCIEFEEMTDKDNYAALLGNDFKCLGTFGCNVIFLNQHQLLQLKNI